MANGPILPRESPSEPRGTLSELHKLQFDYAWKWFSYHADQRVKMFNFMLVALGIFAAAIVSAITNHMAHRATAILCFVAGILALVFGFLDMRNRDLVLIGEELLTALERNVIFGEGIAIKDRGGEDIQFGLLLRQSVEDDARSLDTWRHWTKRVLEKGWLAWGRRLLSDARHGRHRVWLRFIAVVMSVLFFGAGGWIWTRPQ
jgi:hypothetical protein